ncbi:MAG: YceI family protein [Bacteriovoracaceae bacterium]
MKFIILAASIFSLQVSAACLVEATAKDSKVSWTAFKTPKKVGVNGEFRKFSIQSTKKSHETISSLLKDSSFEIDTTSVSTGNPERDQKIVKSFFTTNEKAVSIKGKVTSVNKNEATVQLDINGTKKDVKMLLTEAAEMNKLEGEINVLDFNLKSNLEAITAACKALHEGVTWPEVKIAIEFKSTKTCK